MHYALFEIVDTLSLTPQNIGERIEETLENLGYHTCLPTAADWGYVFRLKTSGRNFDISVVAIKGQEFALSIELSKGIFGSFFARFFAKEIDINIIKSWIDEILGKDLGVVKIKWYSERTWKSTFGKQFWDYLNI